MPISDVGGETMSPYSAEEVVQLERRARRGDLDARRALWSHFLFENDMVSADVQARILFTARDRGALSSIAGRIAAQAHERADSDPRGLCGLRQAEALYHESARASGRQLDSPGDRFLAQEILRLEALHPNPPPCPPASFVAHDVPIAYENGNPGDDPSGP